MFLLLRYLLRLWRKRGPRGTTGTPRPVPQPATRTASAPSAAARGTLAVLAHQIRYDLLASMRNPRARFFTFFFPILLLVIFASVFGHGTTTIDGVRVKLARYYVPGILAMSIINATYANLVMSIAALRETGVLKRRRATPVPPAVLVGGQAIATLVVATIMGALLLGVAKAGYDVGFPPGALVALIVTSVLGALAFACIGYAVSALIGSPDAAQPVVQATMLPLWFISGVFIPQENLGPTLRTIAKLFPVEHLANGLHAASINGTFGGAISATDLLVLAVWGAGAAAFAAWRFSWLPSTATG